MGSTPLADIPAAIQKCRMRIATLPTALLALLVCATPASAQTNAHSSPEDRQRFVSIVQSLERAPLNPSLQDDRKWAIQWLTDAPDVTVHACADMLGGASKKKYAHSPEIAVQYIVAMAAFIIENPGKPNNPDAQQLAGIESALNAYRSMRIAQPDDKSATLERLLEMQSRGELPGFVRKAYLHCSAKGAEELHLP
ncbi:MAG: hypothetical protein ABIV36_10000 [Sphingobium limneticum]